jgi:D-glycero-alpha-D-manno-heptose-7-phosphate kinase
MRLTARAPLRIDFAGGWTDVPFYAQDKGGAVVNAAITRYVSGHIARPDTTGILHALRGDRSYVSYSLDLPSGSGLGSSAAQNVLWLAMVKTSINNTSSRSEIAEMACSLSEMLGILGGKQDEYAAALGGMHFFSFDGTVQAERLDLPLPFQDEMRSRLVLVYSGRSRLSGSIHEHVWSRYRAGESSVHAALDGLKRVAGDVRDALRHHNLDDFSTLLSENWEYQKELHSTVTNSDLEDLFDYAAKHGASGGKACGAGGGGCCVFAVEQENSERLRGAFRARKVDVIDFEFDSYGVFVKKG